MTQHFSTLGILATKHKFDNWAAFFMSATYFIHVMGALRPRHVLRHCWPLENFQGFVRRFPPFHFLITFGLQSLTLHESRRVQKFKAKKKCYILLTSHDHSKVERNKSILKWWKMKDNFKGFLKFFFSLWAWSFALGLSCDTGLLLSGGLSRSQRAPTQMPRTHDQAQDLGTWVQDLGTWVKIFGLLSPRFGYL